MLGDPRAKDRAAAARRLAVRRVALVGLAVLIPLVLAACSSPGPTTITVHGLVTDELLTPLGVAIPGITANAAIGTDVVPVKSDGTFTITGVTAPYDLTVAIPSLNVALVYIGLTRTDPTLSYIDVGNVHTAAISGSIGVTVASGDEAAIFPGSATPMQGSLLLPGGSGPGYGPFTVAWGGSTSHDITLYALTVTASGGPPSAYTGFGSTDVSLTDGGSVTNASITLGSVSTASMSGSVSAPAGFTTSIAAPLIRFGSPTGALVALGSSGGSSFTGVKVPVHSGIAYGIVGAADGPSGSGTAAWANAAGPGTNASLTLPAPSAPTAPASGATGVGTGTKFTVTPLSSAVYVAVLNGPTSSDPSVYVFTDQTSFKLPDLSVVAMSLTGGATYTYSASALGPFTSIDDFTGPGGGPTSLLQLQMLLGGSGTVPYAAGPTDASAGAVFLTRSPSRTVTAAP